MFLGRGRQKKRYWFWFDEQTCQLKYYRSQEAYQHGVFDPLMLVKLFLELHSWEYCILQDC